DTEPLHDGADIWYTKGFSDGTTASVEVLNTAHDAGLWITLTDADGTVLSTVAPAELFGYDISRDIGAQYGGDIFSVQEIALTTDTDGQTLYCILTSEGLAAVYADGRCAWVSDIRGIRAMLTTEAHGLLLLCETRGVQTLTILNADNGHPAETVSPDAGMYTDGDSVTLFSGGAGALYARNRRGIWSLTVAADETGAKTAAGTLLLDYGLSEIAAANVAAAAAPDDKCFYLVLEDDTSEEDERSYLFRYDYVKPEDVVVKEEIVLARLGTHAFLEQVVRDFNQSSDTHRIVIRDYTQYADDEARRRALDTDISSGAIPDLFLIDGSLTDLTDTYSAAGVFADLKPLLQMSPQIEDQEKLTCVKAPFETPLADGTTAQYLLPLSYQICTYVGHPEDFGDAVYASVTAEEMLAFYRRVPEEQYIMQNSFDLQK
ncbi:MAG: hypothetical protein IJ302_06285, partial [Clostridia bacterium]|nr:hypothetical protein [Clostridia bacterium]